jgi:RsiW-degrading membrane proteinase PrsW (M82 family)
MIYLWPFISAIIPIIALIIYIYWCDKNSPEPISQLLKATFFGVLSIPLSLCMSMPAETIGLYPAEAVTYEDGIKIAFWGAAIPEEIAKLIMLWLFLRNKRFKQRLDGIVYAVCISLGFAGLENVLYVIQSEEWVSTAVMRAITAVPGHFCFAVTMGYFYSLVKLSAHNRSKNIALMFVAPIMIHGIYDAILFVASTLSNWISVLLIPAFCYFCYKMWKGASIAIKTHINTDQFNSLKFFDTELEDQDEK